MLNAPGLTPVMAEDGSVLLTNEDGNTLGRIPQPLLLDSSDDDGNGGGVFTAATTLSVDTSGARRSSQCRSAGRSSTRPSTRRTSTCR